MKQTETYQLKLIENSDDFSPDPINANTRAVEGLLAALAGTAVRTAAGSYTGTGGSGADSPCALTLGFRPKFLLVMGEGYSCAFVGGCAKGYGAKHGAPGLVNVEQTVTWAEDGLSWYVAGAHTTSGSYDINGGAVYQLNLSGREYFYFAIG